MFKKYLSHILAGIVIISGLCVYATLFVSAPQPVEQEILGGSVADANWVIIEKFDGFQTKKDASKISNGGNPNGQNTVINDGDRISVRDLGYDHFGTSTASTTAQAINSVHTFRKRSGENIMMRAYSTFMQYFEEGNDTWTTVSSTFTADQEFGFADININTDQQSYVYFGNAADFAVRWTGNHTMTNGAYAGGAGLIVVDSVSGFPETGNLILCDTSVAYTYRSTTNTAFVVGATAPACDDNFGVAEALETQSGSPKGDIYIAKDNRLFITGITSSTQMVMFSAYADATTFQETIVGDGTDDSAGYFNLAEGGGAVTGAAMDENSIYFFKKSLIYKATLTDTLYTITPLKPFDGGKSQTTGAIRSQSVFVGGNGVIFVTPDEQIVSLERVSQVDFPQITAISDVIEPTIKSAVFSSSAGITFGDRSYIAAKTNSDSTYNDVVFVWNNILKIWESPIVGWNVSGFVVYDDGAGDVLYWADAITPNIRKVTSIPLDGVFGVTANWRSKQFTFGAPWAQKEIESVFIEGYIADNTTLSMSLLLDEEGYTQTYTTDFVGTESSFMFQDIEYNLFGFAPFGFERFGSSEDQSGKKKFRLYLNKSFRRVPFYSAQMEFASDGENMQWEITRFGFKTRVLAQPEDRDLYRTFQ